MAALNKPVFAMIIRWIIFEFLTRSTNASNPVHIGMIISFAPSSRLRFRRQVAAKPAVPAENGKSCQGDFPAIITDIYNTYQHCIVGRCLHFRLRPKPVRDIGANAASFACVVRIICPALVTDSRRKSGANAC